MVSSTPPISPIQFSALKGLDPLQDEEQHGEDDDRQAEEKQVPQGDS
jgi:hypothetical protein